MYLNISEVTGLPYPARFSGLIQCALALAILIINRTYFVKGINGIIHRAPGMDALISIGAGVSFVYSVVLLIMGSEGPFFFESAGMIFTLITLGKALESRSRVHTMDAINRLSELLPENVNVIRDGEERTIGLSALSKEDIVIVRAGEGIPADGKVLSGNAAVDKSALTGESLPEDVKAGDEVVSGSIVLDGFITFSVQKTGKETVLSGIIEAVRKAALEKTPVERLADRISGVFVPIVVGLSLLTLFVWIILGYDFSFALKMAINVVVISCPCALGLATPTAIMAGTGNAASNGILIRSSECIETAKNVTTVVLDKTGTVTEGELVVSDVFAKEGVSETELLRTAAVLEAASSHPYAKAILAKAAELFNPRDIMDEPVEEYRNISGKGLTGSINGKPVFGGNEEFLRENGICIDSLSEKAMALKKEGKSVLFFAKESLLGIIAVSDGIRKDSASAVDKMKKSGLKVMLVTGDNENTAKAIAETLGIEDVVAGVLPNDKHRVVEELMNKGECVAMVGDGINDSPALVRADVGIAVGSGTTIAKDSADFIVLKHGISDVPFIFSLSKRVMRIVKQNLFWAFFYNIIGIPLAAGVLYVPFGIGFNPMMAAACMSVSSLFVVLNALRLRK